MDSKELRRQKFLTEPLLPLLARTSVPTIIGMLVMVIYNLTDTFFVGMINNSSMTAAIGIVFSFVSSIQAVGFWFGYGSGNIMSKKLGEKDEEEAEIISSLGLVFSLVVGVLLAAVSRIFLLPLSSLIGGSASEALLQFTREYLGIIIISIPFSLYSITLYNQLRLCGSVRDGMIGLLLGMASNMILDPILMFGFKLGFVGAGYATLLGQIIACLVLTSLAKKNGNIAVTLKKAKLSKERSYHILAGGMPNFSRQAITSLALILLHREAARYGDGLIAALTISSRIFALTYMMMIGWAQGFQPICGMNYGAKHYERVKKAFTLTVVVATVFLSLSAIGLLVFSKSLLHIMTKDPEVIAVGVEILGFQCISMPFLGYVVVSSMFLQNTGKYFWSLLLSVSRQGIFYVPLLFILPKLYGKTGIYLLQPVADLLSFLFALLILWKIRSTYSSPFRSRKMFSRVRRGGEA